ncbi:hypothetical protein [Oceaniglobus roseus]|uniref:hypothetical protein n=1 Tax=Oceaniglobus roseus TaxID=1737570 RepID=UPI000C7F789B|nr:hypothetical protein [Kandeliimicrobium roseum]
MNKFVFGSAVALALFSTSLSAAPVPAGGVPGQIALAQDAQVWRVKGNNGNGNGKGHGPKKIVKGNGNPGKGNGHAGKPEKGHGNGNAAKDTGKPGRGNDVAAKGKGKPDHAGGPKPKARPEQAAQDGNGNGKGNGAKERRDFNGAEREEYVRRIVSTPAPAGRDMAAILGASALAFLTPQLAVADIPEDELITYRNCPPGLAKKDPPCVPPGLAKDGVTYDEWSSWDRDRYDEIWIDRRDDWLRSESAYDPDPGLLLLQSQDIASLFGLDPAPSGQRYGLIDGLPVLLDEQDYTSLLLINQIAQVADVAGGVPIAPTAALTQQELMSLYRLPQLGAGQNYSVLNGQLVQLNDREYDMLQLIRIARAVL